MYTITSLNIKASIFILIFLCASTLHAGDELHLPFTDVLSESVVDGQVNYSKIKSNPKYFSYLKALNGSPSFKNKKEELAYWINAYNALAIKGILDKRSPKSLLGRLGFFKKAKYNVGGRNINLFDLERKVIIPLGEPRIHFAINCASASCPKLIPEAYTEANLENQLEQVTKEFVNNSTKNSFNTQTKVASVSKIFDWFKDDFSNHSGSVQKYLAQYVSDTSIAADLREDKYRIVYKKYDWSLNGTKP